MFIKTFVHKSEKSFMDRRNTTKHPLMVYEKVLPTFRICDGHIILKYNDVKEVLKSTVVNKVKIRKIIYFPVSVSSNIKVINKGTTD